jgi:hypothetical protein
MIKTSKAYYEGYKIVHIETGKQFIAEKIGREWKLFELDEFGDIYGYKEWWATVDTLKECKQVAEEVA